MVGRILGVTALGYFAIACNVGGFISSHFTSLISKVMFPAYSAIRDDKDDLKRAYLKTVRFVSMCSIPFGIFLICLAKEFVLTLYGPKWMPVVPLIRLFGFMQLVAQVAACSGSVFMACGKPKYIFNLQLASLIIRIPLMIWFTKSWGLVGNVSTGLIMMVGFVPINIELVRKLVSFDYKEFFAQLIPSIYCSLIMLVSILLAKTLFSFGRLIPNFAFHYMADLVILGSIGMASYIIAFLLIDRASSLEVKRMIFKLERA